MRLPSCFALVVVLVSACTPATPRADATAVASESQASPSAVPSSAAEPTTAPRADALPPARSTDIARIGLLTDALRAPLAVVGDASDAPAMLARRVKAGGDDALAALMGALKASGVAIVGPNDELVMRPAEPWQGLIVKSWEVRLLLASVLPERTVTMTLAQFTDALRAVPELNAPALDTRLVDDLRTLAGGRTSPKQFWARFIIELGRDAAAIDENDLASAHDVAQLKLNGLQTSLILRRMSLDLQMLGNRGTRSGVPHVAMSLLGSSAAADQPCQMTDTQKTILEIASFGTKAAVDGFKVFDLGFEGLFGYLENIGLASSGTAAAVEKFRDATGIAGALLTYAEFIATYAALEVKIDMESAPLTRTKQVRPASGETKELTATVRLNTGNAQILNCFRIMLNALGLDFKVAQDGPVKGARVGWQPDAGFSQLVESRGGPDQIVRFVGDAGSQYQSGGAFTSSNSITNAATGPDGRTTVKVEGVGQRVKKSENAAKVMKRASVHVDVALQGADLFSDLQDAAGNAVGGVKALVSLPLDVLKRSQWASEGHYSFEVIDWSGTQWSGTVSMTRTEVSKREVGGRSSQATTVDEATVHITAATIYQNFGDDSVANMTGTIAGRYERTSSDSLSWTQLSDSRICVGQTFSGTDVETESSKGSGSGDAQITVRANGLDYEITASAADNVDDMPVSGQIEKQGHKLRQAGNGCANVVVDKTTEAFQVRRTEPMLGISIKGRVDPDEGGDRLAGSTTTVQDLNGTTSIKITLKWDLRRD